MVEAGRSDDLKAIFVQKSKKYDERTITGKSKESLGLTLAGAEADNWEVLRRNKRSIRLKKDKPQDRQLEDDLWCLLYRMGFHELNTDRKFAIRVDEKTQPRLLDVFAKDDESVIIIECTHSRTGGNKSIKSLIDKINAIRADIVTKIHQHYGRPRIKVKFAIATHDIAVRDGDRARAEASGIPIITEADLAYFQRVTDYIKTAARYQFLGRYLRDERVEGLRTKVPATRGRMGGQVFYNFLMSPHDLLKIAYISHKAKTSNDDLETYQRMVKPSRLKEIGRYIDDDGQFPTNIVINLKTSNPLQFDLAGDDAANGFLHLPGLYGSAWVIDGQHRLYGYAHAKRDEASDRSVLPVLAYENLPTPKEIKLFVDINTKQVKVPAILVKEIVSSLDISDPDPKRRLEALEARIVMMLDDYAPTKDRILIVSGERTHKRCLTLNSFCDGISDNSLIGTIERGSGSKFGYIKPGPLSDLSDNPTATMRKAVSAIAQYLNLFAENLEVHWKLGDAKGGYLATNNGIRALLRLFGRVIAFSERTDNVRFSAMDADEIIERVTPYVRHVVDYFKHASATEITETYRNVGSSRATVDQSCFKMMAEIYSREPSFETAELAEWRSRQDIAGTSEARKMIDDIEGVIFGDVINTLQAKWGPLLSGMYVINNGTTATKTTKSDINSYI
jgi:DNA sulfur modification protein DndB